MRNKKIYNLCTLHQKEEADIFNELVGSFAYGFKKRGHEVYTSVNRIKNDAVNIIFGSHVSPSIKYQLPPNTIIYNTEQAGSIWMLPDYIDLLKSFKVWDYSKYNARLLNEVHGVADVIYNPIGYVPILERVKQLPELEKDIDVLLYGSINVRRKNILEALDAKGLKTVYAFQIYGELRDTLIARSKIVLNVHYYPTAITEAIRLSYLLTNNAFVVSEKGKDWRNCPEYLFTMVMSDYDWLTEDILEYVYAPKRRENVARCGYQIFKEFKQEDIINED